jgi:hypothetical protein
VVVRAVPEAKTVILFVEKTWFLWWMLGIVFVVRWFHLVAVTARMARPGALALDKEEEEAYIRTWRVLRKAQVISSFDAERAH